jgi:beta-galactosidase/beta-glucuronidase
LSLDGPWEFALDELGRMHADEVRFERTIRVPFSPETRLSGIAAKGFFNRSWYRRSFKTPRLARGECLLLHFGAVDYEATVWINGQMAGHHAGGYTPFTFNITRFLVNGPEQTILVRADDDPTDLAKPRGKQDWQAEPHSIWYPRTSGIWQTVWLEIVPETYIENIRWTSNLERWEITLHARLSQSTVDRLRLHVRLSSGELTIADDTYSVSNREVLRRIALSDPGVDDYRNELLWCPERPRLIDAEIELWGERGELVDSVRSYTALRAVGTQRDRFLLNGRPYYLRMVLDQGYWPGGGATAPDDEALRRDVELAKQMGFNGVRKHQKIEDPRYLFWADTLGLMVWVEMPSAYRFTDSSVRHVTREWIDVVTRDYSHPSVVTWVPFNESWGVPNLPDSLSERHYVQGLYHLTKTLDATRPVLGNDGWESVATDIIGIHDYDDDPDRMARRYRAEEVLPRLFRRERPGGRLLILDDRPPPDQPLILSEFGGIACPSAPGTWGYAYCATPEDFSKRYTRLLETVRSLGVLAGFCYTQFADTYQEANGLLRPDRTPKFPIAEIARATRGLSDAPPPVEPLDAVRLPQSSET